MLIGSVGTKALGGGRGRAKAKSLDSGEKEGHRFFLRTPQALSVPSY